MRSFILFFGLLLAGGGVVDGANSCFAEKCESGSDTVNLYGCDLTDADIPDMATCLDDVGRDGIETLVLGGNDLTTLPAGTFEGLGALVRLLLNGNQLSDVTSGAFDGLPELQYLYLNSNSLTTLPGGLFDGLGSLKYLTVSQNDLSGLPSGLFDGLDALSNLYFTDNGLTTLPEGIFSDLGSLRKLYLAKNPDLQCIPANGASTVKTDDISFDECECTPEAAVLCDDGLECEAGEFGYTCGAATQKQGDKMHLSDVRSA